MTPSDTSTATRRPRVADDREGEILDATIRVLSQVGYDRLTMDLVATEAHASKATLYRHWTAKAELVVDAVSRAKGMPNQPAPDTGSLKGDLTANWCGKEGWGSTVPMAVIGGLVTALHTDPALAEAFRERFMIPRFAITRQMFTRALERGEITKDVDIDMVMSILPAICTFREAVMGEAIDEPFVHRLIERVVLPAAGITAP